MRKMALVGIATVTAIGVGWSASTLAKSKVVKAEVMAASAPIVPHEIMARVGQLPAEYWSHPF
jgi:hypothetical protein